MFIYTRIESIAPQPAGLDNDQIFVFSGGAKVEGGAGNDQIFSDENGLTTVTDSGGVQDYVIFEHTNTADLIMTQIGNDLSVTSAAGWADSTNNNGFLLKDFFLSTDHVEYIVGADAIPLYIGDLVI